MTESRLRIDVLNLDTHIFLDALGLSLSKAEQRVLDGDTWCISGMVLWEIEMLARSRRIRVDLATPDLLVLLDQVRIVPIDIHIAQGIRLLDFRSDPADELIAATSVQLNLPLVTRDENILRSKVVPIIHL